MVKYLRNVESELIAVFSVNGKGYISSDEEDFRKTTALPAIQTKSGAQTQNRTARYNKRNAQTFEQEEPQSLFQNVGIYDFDNEPSEFLKEKQFDEDKNNFRTVKIQDSSDEEYLPDVDQIKKQKAPSRGRLVSKNKKKSFDLDAPGVEALMNPDERKKKGGRVLYHDQQEKFCPESQKSQDKHVDTNLPDSGEEFAESQEDWTVKKTSSSKTYLKGARGSKKTVTTKRNETRQLLTRKDSSDSVKSESSIISNESDNILEQNVHSSLLQRHNNTKSNQVYVCDSSNDNDILSQSSSLMLNDRGDLYSTQMCQMKVRVSNKNRHRSGEAHRMVSIQESPAQSQQNRYAI